MSDKPMTPGQLAHAAYERAMVERWAGTPDLWTQIHPQKRQVFDEVAAAVRKQMIELFGVDEVFITEAAAVFETLAKEYPLHKGPIEIADAMIRERNSFGAFKARVKAGENP